MRFLKTEAGAIILWIIGVISLAAAIFPWLYSTGKNLAVRAAAEDLPGILESIGKSAGKAGFDTYFSRCLYVSVILLLPVLIFCLRSIRRKNATAVPEKPAPLSWKTRLTHLAGAIVLAGGLLWLLGSALELAGAFRPDNDPPSIGKILKKSLVPAVFAAVIEEWLFRGLLLGIWLRIAKPMTALFSVSFVFAFVHFLQPPESSLLPDPSAPFAGFRLLGLIFSHFADPLFIAAEFIVLFTIGLILGATRLRTGSLWFPIGLHAGWIAAFKGFNMLHDKIPSDLRPLWIGESLRSGLLPLFTLLLTGAICHFVLRCTKTISNTHRI